MANKGQQKLDEFAWVILGSIIFVLGITILFSSGIATPTIEPKNIEFTLERGATKTFSITVRNDEGQAIKNVTLSGQGEIKDWLTFDRSRFDVENTTTINVRVDVPRSAALRTYTGSIKAESLGGTALSSVKIIVANESQLKLNSRLIFLGDFDIAYTKGFETVFTKSDMEVSKGLFSETKQSFSIPLSAEKMAVTTGGSLEMTITESNQRGNLIVLFNGDEVYNKKTPAGKIVIPIEKVKMNETNIVNIRTTGPPFFLFWTSVEYKIEKFDFVLNVADVEERGTSFALTDTEVSNFRYFVLKGRVTEYSSPLPELFVRINHQIVYAKQPPLTFFNETLRTDILGNKIGASVNNTITFAFEKQGSLTLRDAFVEVLFS